MLWRRGRNLFGNDYPPTTDEKRDHKFFETVCCYSRVGQGSPFFYLFIRGEMQVCGFVDGLVGGRVVGSRICLPASTLSSPFCFLFLFLDTDHSALGFRRPPAQGNI